MSKFAELLIEQRNKAWEQGKAIIDTAEAEGRSLSGEDKAALAKIDVDMTELRSQIDTHKKFLDDNASAEAALNELRNRPTEVASPQTERVNDELRSFLKGERRSFDVTRPEGTSSPLTSLTERRALSVGTSTAGGNTVPVSFYNKLWMNLILTAQLINAGATVLETEAGNPIQMPTVTSNSTAVQVSEAAALTESDPAFGQITLNAYKYGLLITASHELVQDSAFDLASYLAMQAGRAAGNAIGTDFVSGNGGSKPTGLITQTTLGATGSTGVVGAPNFDDLIKLYHSVISPYRSSPSTAWFLNDLTAGVIRTLKDSTGRYLWQPALNVGDPDTILGKPVYTDPNMPTVALNAKSVAFGDLAAYTIRIAGPIRFEQSLDYAFNTDQVAFRCIIRGDGNLIDRTGAVKHFVGAAS